MAGHADLQLIAAGKFIGRQHAALPQGRNGNKQLILIVARQRIPQGLRRLAAPQLAIVQGQGHRHAAVIVIHNGAKDRGLLQAGKQGHFRDMLVLQVQAVDPGAIQGLIPALPLIFRDHFFAAAAVARQGKGADQAVLRQDAHAHQGRAAGDKAGGVAAGICQQAGAADLIPLALAQLRQAVDPVRIRAVGGGGVNKTHPVALRQFHRFLRRRIGQAEENDVRGVDQAAPLIFVLPLIFIDQQKLNIVSGGKAVIDLQAGGAFLAVNINFRFHQGLPLFQSSRWATKASIAWIWRLVSATAGPP